MQDLNAQCSCLDYLKVQVQGPVMVLALALVLAQVPELVLGPVPVTVLVLAQVLGPVHSFQNHRLYHPLNHLICREQYQSLPRLSCQAFYPYQRYSWHSLLLHQQLSLLLLQSA